MNKKISLRVGQAGLILCAPLWVALTGCAGDANKSHAGSDQPPVPSGPVAVDQDGYQHYRRTSAYGSHSHRTFYRSGPSWIAHSEPRGIPLQPTPAPAPESVTAPTPAPKSVAVTSPVPTPTPVARK